MRQLEALHTLKLEATLRSVPDSVRGLTTLKLLDLSGCELRHAWLKVLAVPLSTHRPNVSSCWSIG